MRRLALALTFTLISLQANAQIAASGAYSGVTVGTSSAALGTGTPTYFLDLSNQSPTATICINFGSAATISGTTCAAGELTLPPLWHRSWESIFVPTDTLYGIASAASTPLSVGVK